MSLGLGTKSISASASKVTLNSGKQHDHKAHEDEGKSIKEKK